MANSLATKVTFRSLLTFALPTIIMMIFMSLYTMVDGIFVSRFVGTDALAAVNIVFPLVCVVMAVSIMFATGGSAIIARKMGEAKPLEAKQNFTLIILVGVGVGLLFLLLGLLLLEPLLHLLGASAALYAYCYDYTLPMLWFVPLAMLQMLFQTFFVTAGKPGLGLAVTGAGGIANLVLDYVFIVPLDMGIAGAALATGIGYSIPALFGLLYFSLNKRGSLHFVKPVFDGRVLFESCTNGSSEMVTNLSSAITTYLFNIMMLRYLGEDGVAAITIVLYAQFLLTSLYLGYSSGVAPVVSYNYGTGDTGQLRKIFRISMGFLLGSSLMIFGCAIFFADLIAGIFTTTDSYVFELTVHGFSLFAVGFLFMGINIFASALFTALSNGKISALLSFLRTFVFIVTSILLLPQILQENGIWLAIPVAELLGIFCSIFYLRKLDWVHKPVVKTPGF